MPMQPSQAPSAKEIATLARWLWPGAVHQQRDGHVVVRLPREQGWFTFRPVDAPRDLARAYPILRERGQFRAFLSELEVQLHKKRSLKPRPPVPSRRSPRRLTQKEREAWFGILGHLDRYGEDLRLRLTRDMRRWLGGDLRLIHPRTGCVDASVCFAMPQGGDHPYDTYLIELIEELPPIRRKIVLLGAVARLVEEDVRSLTNLPYEDVEWEMQEGVYEVRAGMLERHGVVWHGSGYDFSPRPLPASRYYRSDPMPAVFPKEVRLQQWRQVEAEEEGRGLQAGFRMVLIDGALRRAGGGDKLKDLVSPYLQQLTDLQLKVLLKRFLEGASMAETSERLELEEDQVSFEGRQGLLELEGLLLSTARSKAVLAQMTHAMLCVAREERGGEQGGV